MRTGSGPRWILKAHGMLTVTSESWDSQGTTRWMGRCVVFKTASQWSILFSNEHFYYYLRAVGIFITYCVIDGSRPDLKGVTLKMGDKMWCVTRNTSWLQPISCPNILSTWSYAESLASLNRWRLVRQMTQTRTPSWIIPNRYDPYASHLLRKLTDIWKVHGGILGLVLRSGKKRRECWGLGMFSFVFASPWSWKAARGLEMFIDEASSLSVSIIFMYIDRFHG